MFYHVLMPNEMLYQLYYSPFPKLQGFLIKNLDKVYPYVVAYMTFRTNLQLIIYNEFLSTTLVEVTLVSLVEYLSKVWILCKIAIQFEITEVKVIWSCPHEQINEKDEPLLQPLTTGYVNIMTEDLCSRFLL